MKGQTYVILAIVFVIIISVFSVLNIEQVEVNYLFWSGSSPLIFVILFSVLLGGILTTVVGIRKYISLKRENSHLRNKLRELGVDIEATEQEVELKIKEDKAEQDEIK